jgi:phosphoribosylanthranilate isomerase
MSLWIKICGNTSLADARLAVNAGADAVGFVFAPSPRRVTADQVAAITQQLPLEIEKIGVFVNAPPDEIVATVERCGLTGVQLHSEVASGISSALHERLGPQLRILRVVHFSAEPGEAALLSNEIAAIDRDPHVRGLLVDSRTPTAVGGTGVAFDWHAARAAIFQIASTQKPRIAAGGLSPVNVAEAIATLRPWGVDVASGVEAAPGRKDADKVHEFVARGRAAR